MTDKTDTTHDSIFLGQRSPIPRIRLHAPERQNVARTWDNDLYREHKGIWRLQGSAGSGVSSLILDTVAKRIEQGYDPASIIVIGTTQAAVASLRRGLAQRLSDSQFASTNTIVRSVHSLAFAMLRINMAEHTQEELRLIPGAQQDAVMRELLAGHAAAGAPGWPEQMREAVGMLGFARQLRDFLLRSAERGVGPEDLEELGARFHRPMWTSAGAFMREYEQTMELGGNRSLSASELISAALAYSATDYGFRTVIVDDAQNLDPQAARLIDRLLHYADFGIIAGNPQHSIFHFRGAHTQFLEHYPVDHELYLSDSYRQPNKEVHILDSENKQWELAADTFRRKHLLEAVRWRDMALIVRSSTMVDAARRTLLAAGVPVHTDPGDIILAEQPIVAALLRILRSLSQPLSARELEDLALGPLGGADPATMRRLLRGLRLLEIRRGGTRRAIEVLQIIISAQPEHQNEKAELYEQAHSVLTQRELDILDRISKVFIAAAQAYRSEANIEEALWAVWSTSGLAEHLLAVSLRGGTAGAQADRDLDAVMALFDAASDWVRRRPGASIHSFLVHIDEQELPTGVRDRRVLRPDAVQILTAHSVGAQEWDIVFIAGVQENTWPDMAITGSLFGQEELIDYLDSGIEPGTPVSQISARVAEEKRLFELAISRATTLVQISAVDDPEGDIPLEPSRFIYDIPGAEYYDSHDKAATTTGEQHAGADSGTSDASRTTKSTESTNYFRFFSLSSLVSELRRAVSDEENPPQLREQAARQLAKLAEAGVPGADPDSWWGIQEPSESEPITVRSLSPSAVEKAMECPLRVSLDNKKLSADASNAFAMHKGTLAHAYAEAITNGMSEEKARALVNEAFVDLAELPSWRKDTAIEEWENILAKLRSWLAGRTGKTELLGVEVSADVRISDSLRLRGRIDRLDKTEDGVCIVDIKTSKTAISVKDAEDNKQLLTYQLMLSRSQLEEQDGEIHIRSIPMRGTGNNSDDANDTARVGIDVDEAMLVYPATTSKGVTVRSQTRRTRETLDELAAELIHVAQELRGPTIIARKNKQCDLCDYKSICPVQPEGKTVLS
ncbi:ATP-dependent helicase [Corynebacterium sp. sy017]|uniref:ATP-dependent DNA helicase n=1 Tax=unclassified Corynebacterium TaxID=2624378 RepID=UPI0011872E68|nr:MULTISPECIES: ATP-dependent DNA helicase [unclassified Corynebacterium]MBP3088755.1 ATP-dependent helicase [Corynebacterium sp. sy017]TSD92036.1 ATP-dependent helicase [Corynebacterium sp. SY003]